MLEIAWTLLAETTFFVLIGFLLAGVLHGVLARERLVGLLRGRGSRTVFLATFVGLPLPLCSCSVLPTALAIHRRGASPGATLSFLVSTPETSVTSVLLTYGLLGPVMAVCRPLAALVTAIAAGLVGNVVSGGSTPSGDAEIPRCEDCDCAPEDAPPSETISLRAGLRFAFVDLFDDIFLWILGGVLVAAALRAWVPPETLGALMGDPARAMLVAVAVGVPLYVCAEASTPIAAALIASGVSPGAALVFLLVGPATNFGSIGVLAGALGRRVIAAYLATIVLVSVGAGLALDAFIPDLTVAGVAYGHDRAWLPAWMASMAGGVFLLLGVLTVRRKRYVPRLVRALTRK